MLAQVMEREQRSNTFNAVEFTNLFFFKSKSEHKRLMFRFWALQEYTATTLMRLVLDASETLYTKFDVFQTPSLFK
jgi:hypothetical protein